MKNTNNTGRVIARKNSINNSKNIYIPDDVCRVMDEFGKCCKSYNRDGNIWFIDNMRFEFNADMHVSIYINNRFIQGYTGKDKILHVMTEHVRLNQKN